MLVRYGEEEAAQVGGISSGERAWSGALPAAVEAIATEEHNSPARRGIARLEEEMALRAVIETAAGSGAAPWESIELEIVRVLEAINELRESPDYELHRLTERVGIEWFSELQGLR